MTNRNLQEIAEFLEEARVSIAQAELALSTLLEAALDDANLHPDDPSYKSSDFIVEMGINDDNFHMFPPNVQEEFFKTRPGRDLAGR